MRASLAWAFFWQLARRVAEDSFAQGLLPSEDEKRRRSDSTLGAMLVWGNLAILLQGVLFTAALLAWLVSGRGPGGKLVALGAGSPTFGPTLRARVRAHRPVLLAESERTESSNR